jgi:hypothetical protein
VRTDPEPVTVIAVPPCNSPVTAANLDSPNLPLSGKTQRGVMRVLAKEAELFVSQLLNRIGKVFVAVPKG